MYSIAKNAQLWPNRTYTLSIMEVGRRILSYFGAITARKRFRSRKSRRLLIISLGSEVN